MNHEEFCLVGHEQKEGCEKWKEWRVYTDSFSFSDLSDSHYFDKK